MSQADGNVANATGAVFRTDLNNQLAALWTQHSGNAAPSPTYAFQPWIDSSTSPATWRVRNSANNGWIVIGTLDATFAVGGVTPIANGGTGQTTATAAINALLPSQTGNSGEFLTTNGTDVSWATTGASPTVQIFTSSTTWTCPAGVTRIVATVIGGGGGGGQGFDDEAGIFFNGGYGGYAGIGIGVLTVTPSTVYTVTVGAGGNGSNGAGGAAGGSSSFLPQGGSALITATGGSGGGSASSSANGTNGASGTCSTTDANVRRTNISVASAPYVTGSIIERVRAASSTTAQAWSITSGFSPGSRGSGESSSSSNATGGIGGVILLQYWGA
jgi:hypothetical protein